MKIAKKMKFATPMVNAYRLVRECTQNVMETTLVITMKKHACQNVKVIKSVVKAWNVFLMVHVWNHAIQIPTAMKLLNIVASKK